MLESTPNKNSRFFPDINSEARKEMKFSPIETEKFVLQAVREDEWEDFYKLYSNPEIMELFDTGETYSKEKTRALVTEFAKAWRSKDFLAPLSIRNHKGEFLGFINLRHAPCKQPGQVEIGYMILKEHQGNNYGALAAKEVLRYLENLAKKGYLVKGAPLTTVLATVEPTNRPSLKVLKEIGLKEIEEGVWQRSGQPRRFFYKSLVALQAADKFEFRPEELFDDVEKIHIAIKPRL